ncbi:MAG TPA: LysE family transporter [Clostridia bacterium]|nr:LysE family transporter [Clostridia bacterium]
MNLVPFLSYVFVTTFTPGPNNIMSMTNANRDGFRKTVNFNLGVFAGFMVIMLACSYFNLLLFNLIPRIKAFMGIIGSAYMVYLAYKLCTSKHVDGESDSTHMNSFITGLMLQFVNPKVIMYGITTVSSFIIPYYSSHAALILFSFFLAFIGFISTTCWALFGAMFQMLLSKRRKAFNITMSLLLLYSAIAIFNMIF